jgi:hypothetical protein
LIRYGLKGQENKGQYREGERTFENRPRPFTMEAAFKLRVGHIGFVVLFSYQLTIVPMFHVVGMFEVL